MKALRLALCLALVSSTALARGAAKAYMEARALALPSYNVWSSTRSAAVILVGTLAWGRQGVTITVTRVVKGGNVPKTLTVSSSYYFTPPARGTAAAGATWLVFLQGLGTKPATYYMLGPAYTGQQLARQEALVKRIMQLDALPNRRAKCRLLVQMLSETKRRLPHAERELRQYNGPDCVEELAPLAKHPRLEGLYVRLLSWNPSPKAVGILKEMLGSARGPALPRLITAAGYRATSEPALRGQVLRFLEHPDPQVRAAAVTAFGRDNTPEILAHIAKRLADEDSRVRLAALAHPWWDYAREHPEVAARIRKMTGAPGGAERAAACRALIHLGSARSFYALWWRSLFDSDRSVRESIALGLLWEESPTAVSILLLWPTLLALALGVLAARRFKLPAARWWVTLGIFAGYAAGLVFGVLIGKHHSGNPGLGGFVLMPALVLPVAIALALAWSWAGKSSKETAAAAPSSVAEPLRRTD